MLFADELCPPFLASVGCHIANEYQRKSKNYIFSYKGLPEDICLHIVIVSPAGFSKSYLFKLFLNKEFGIVPIRSKIAGKLTEAGFVGTVKEGALLQGLASAYRDGIIAFNEISNLFLAEESSHSKELVNQVMECLTERHINKRLGSGEIDYDTYLTMWGGIQPARFDFSGGLGRRFLFVGRVWLEDDIETLKKERVKRRAKVDYTRAKEIRHSLNNLKIQFEVDEIRWEDRLIKNLLEIADSHLQMNLFEKALIGKNVIDWDGEKILKIKNTEDNLKFVKMLRNMQDYVALGSDICLLMSLLKEQRKQTRDTLWNYFRRFGYTYEKFDNLLQNCLKMGLIGWAIDPGSNNRYYYKRN